jgi:hypothetical protein
LIRYDTWKPYEGNDALLLSLGLFAVGCVLVYLGTRRHHPVGVDGPGKAVSALLIMMWCFSLATFLISVGVYARAQIQQGIRFVLPADRIWPITASSGLVTFTLIAYLSRRYGLKIALGSAIAGAISAPMIFELPFDLIVMWRTYPPTPGIQFTLLFFLPLFLVEISSFSLLTLSPLTRISKHTLFSLAAMFFVFTVWALFGFSYPSSPVPFALNAVSKVLSFVTAVTLFLGAGVEPRHV